MPGTVTTVRTAKNVTGRTQTYTVQVSSPAKSKITVSPSGFTVKPGRSVDLRITITSTATGQQFGQIRFAPVTPGLPTLHLPVGFVPRQGAVTVTSSCTPETVRWLAASTCAITAQNTSSTGTTANLKTETNVNLLVTQATGAKVTGPFSVEKKNVPLAGTRPGVPSVAPGTIAGEWISLPDAGITPDPIGDEEIINYNVPQFVYNGVRYSSVGVDSNGYLIAGGGTADDNQCCDLPDQIGDPTKPNNILAPFWTDLDGTGTPGILATVRSDGTSDWIVIEWQVNVFGTTSNRHFQVWIGLGDEQDITFAYDPAALPAAPGDQPFLVGAENQVGDGGGLPAGTLPTRDLRVTSTAPTPGGTASYTVKIRGVLPGDGKVTTSMTSPIVPGTTVVSSTVKVTR
jgi:hypothetical protein